MNGLALYLVDWGPRLFEAASLTLLLTAAGFGGAFLLGLALEAMRTSRSARLRGFVGCYVWVLRAIPLLIVLYMLYFVLPGIGLTLSPFLAGTLGLVLVHGAYLAEVLRAGMQTVEQGQWEAARALGLSRLLCLRLVVIPQAVRQMSGPLIVALISVLKDSSVCALIGVNELTLTARAIMSESFMPLHVFLFAGLFYLALGWPASLLARAVERRMNSLQGRQPRHLSTSRRPVRLAPLAR
ncbi:MAG TPA: amino acid ABC transporter permease [Mesorhizobium sp.]|jgi:polar amino acid transport system permease protein|uniref:amino acid ABC transporter permease n=1 Tax=Mesorhizobium sp. TaxID=1871066 RepID=UPI002DDCB31A|nr:amino acid ABC transporter permease [Mesorhizobium sp.]HEV2507875.1 amino acid ABC transporter permease [Mesorhizobium sp.]